jgi:putative acetyltransferase
LVTIRPEEVKDHAAIHEVNLLAFGGEKEAQLVEAIRGSANFIPELSLVALKNGQVVGHILFSPITIEAQNGPASALALAPLAVRPKFQNQGIGSRLVRQGLKECRCIGYKIVVVVGHPSYYPRFGFSSARAKGLEAPFRVSDEAFMVLELVPGALDGVSGMVKYPPAFDEVS